ncbi:MAG: histidine--tRNA ligase family protein, partial [Deltaproteobacteria bacterium]|nr:histidine--tRNA ligase family protein [Deltaproteobacteria bacterium]
IVGSESMLADAEVITTIYHVLKSLHFKQFTIRINNRKLLNGIAKASGIEEATIPSLLRIIDKLEQKGMQGIKDEMFEKGFKEENIKAILELFSISDGNKIELLTIKKRFGDSALVLEGIGELEEIFSHLSSMGVDPQFYCFDFSLARGLDYYTGPIFETTVDEPQIGSITGGGRYDTLIGMFSNTDFPATGSSFGLERIITVMEELNITPSLSTITDSLVTVFSPEMQKDSLQIATELRSAGIKTEVYFKHDKLKKQLAYASNKGIPFTIIMGPDEQKDNNVTLRNMVKGNQKSVSRDELVYTIKNDLSEL